MKLLPIPLRAQIKEAYYLMDGKRVDQSNLVFTNAVILGENNNPDQEDCFFGYWDTIQTQKNPGLILLRFPKNGVRVIRSEVGGDVQTPSFRKSA